MLPYFGDEVGEPGDDLGHQVIIALCLAHQTRPGGAVGSWLDGGGEDGGSGGEGRMGGVEASHLPLSVNSAMESGVGTLVQYSSSLASMEGSVARALAPGPGPWALAPGPGHRWALSRGPSTPRGTILPRPRPSPLHNTLEITSPVASQILLRHFSTAESQAELQP